MSQKNTEVELGHAEKAELRIDNPQTGRRPYPASGKEIAVNKAHSIARVQLTEFRCPAAIRRVDSSIPMQRHPIRE